MSSGRKAIQVELLRKLEGREVGEGVDVRKPI